MSERQMYTQSSKIPSTIPARAVSLVLMLALLAVGLGMPAASVRAAPPVARTFTPHPSTPAFATDSLIPNDVQLGDVDGDGDLDALLVQFDRAQPDTIWYNNGSGGFTTSANLPLGPSTEAWGSSMNGVLVDIDNDSDLDALVSNFDRDIEENVWRNNGSGSFTWFNKFNSLDRTRWLAMGNLDGNGSPDVLIVHGFNPWITGSNDGLGNFTLITNNEEYHDVFVYHAALANFDNRSGSTDLDAVMTGSFGASVKFNNGDGSFPIPPAGTYDDTGTLLRDGNTRVALTGDLDLDGDIDIVLGSPDAAAGGTTGSQVFLGDGFGNFSAGSLLPSTSGNYVRRGDIGDLNSDGYLDVVLVNDNNAYDEIFLNDANSDEDGVVEFIPNEATPSVLAGTKTTSARLGDIDGDGDLDLLTTNERLLDGGGNVIEPGGVKVWLNNPVSGANEPPVVGNIPLRSTSEDQAITPLNLALYVTDPEGSPLTFSSPSRGALTPAGVFNWTPSESEILASGDVTVTFQVTDGVNPVTGSFVVNVTETNQNPAVDPITDRNASEGTQLSFDLNPFVSDSDVSEQTLTFALTPPSVGAIDPTTHVFTWTPSETHGGSPVTVNFTVTDTMGGSATGTFDINVAEVNQLPVLDVPASGTYFAVFPLHIVLSGHDGDLPADTLTYGVVVATLPAGAVFDVATHTLTWTPSVAQVGDHVIAFTINDGHGTTNFNRILTITEPMRIYLPLVQRMP